MTANIWNPNSDVVPQVNATGTVKEENQTATQDQRVINLQSFAFSVNTGAVAVYRNGLRLARNIDFIEGNETQIILTQGADAGDELTVQGFIGISGVIGTDPVLRSDLYASTGSANIRTIQSGAGAVVRNLLDKSRESLSVTDYGAIGDGVNDDSAAIQAAFAELQRRGGGKLNFPRGTFRFYLDVSGNTTFIEFVGNYSTFKPAASKVHPCIIYCDNSGTVDAFQHTYTQYDRCFFDANNETDHCVRLISSCADFIRCNILNAKVAGFYGYYAQYCRFEHVTFAGNNNNNSSYGCYLSGPDSNHRTNECLFFRCQFFSNANGLYIGGAEGTRIYVCTFQDHRLNGNAALYIHTDDAGNSARYTDVIGNWFEINQSKAILIGIAEGTNLENNKLFGNPTYTCVVQSITSYDLRFVNNSALSFTTVTFAHPNGNADTASVTILGNNIWPVLNIDHAGPSYVSGASAATQTYRKDSMLLTTGQHDKNSVPVVGISEWAGIKPSVAKGVSTPIFKITQQAYNTPANRIISFILDLHTWDNNDANTQFGYVGHHQQYKVFITNNQANGVGVNVIIKKLDTGTEFSISETWQTVGDITLTADVAGEIITFSAQWTGAGAGVAGMTTQSIAYTLRGMATNSFYLTRFN